MATIFAVTLLFFLSLDVYVTAYPLHLRGLGWPPPEIGTAVGALGPAALLARPLMGRLTDRRGPRVALALSLAAFALPAAAMAHVTAFPAMLALRLLQGAGLAGAVVATQALAAARAGASGPRARVGRALAWQGTADSLGLVVGPLAGERVYARLGPEAFFLLAAALPAAGLVAVTALRDPDAAPPAAPASPAGAQPPARLVAWIAACATLPLGAELAFWGLHAAGQGLAWPAAYVAAGAGAMIAGRWVAAALHDTGGARLAPAAGVTAAGAGALLAALPLTPARASAALALIGSGFGLAHTALLAAVTARTPPERRGRTLAVLGNAVDFGIWGGALGLGWVVQFAGLPAAFGAAGAAALLLGLPAALAARAAPFDVGEPGAGPDGGRPG